MSVAPKLEEKSGYYDGYCDNEGLLKEKAVYKPFRYPWCYDAWLTQQRIHWLPEEVPLGDDVRDWQKNLTVEEKNLLTHIFRFFTQADVEVNNCYLRHYTTVFKPTEVLMMMTAFAAMETVHIAAYSHLLDTIGMPESEYSAFMKYKEMKDKYDYMQGFDVKSNHDIAKTIGLDPRIGTLFLNAGPGYGGSCLPKDMKALINFADKVGINPTLLNAVEKTNQKQVQNIVLLMEKILGTLGSKRITILGTAFKPNTDDVRDSIAIELIKKLLKKKSRITIYDPKAMKNTRRIFGEKIICAKSITDALNKSQCAVFMTHWKQYDTLNNNSIKHMNKKIIVDCRRVLAKKELDAEYYAIGIGKNE